jgi:serine/threonine protein kinase
MVVLTRQIKQGVLQDGIVAVKKLSNSHTINDEAFYRETTFLMSVKHKNVVRFLGFCAHTEHKVMKWEGPEKYIYPETRERLLCFEYMRKGSLSNHVTGKTMCHAIQFFYLIHCLSFFSLNYLHFLVQMN